MIAIGVSATFHIPPGSTVGSLPVDARVDPEFRPCRFELSGETSRLLSHGREAALPCTRSPRVKGTNER